MIEKWVVMQIVKMIVENWQIDQVGWGIVDEI